MATSPQPGNVIPFPTQLRTRVQALQDDDAGVAQTIHAMRVLATYGTLPVGGKTVVYNEGALHPAIRALAVEIVRGAAARNDYAQAVAVFDWVKRNIEFRGEYDEYLQTPLVTAQLRAGDCDDHATLIGALLRALGIGAGFFTVALDPADPERQFSHVYTAAWIRAKQAWLPLDTTVERSYPGWQPERITRIKGWKALSGLGQDGEQDMPQQLQTQPSQGVRNAIELLNASAGAFRNIYTVVKPNAAAAFDVQRTPGGITGNVGVGGISTTTMLIGVGALAAIAWAMSGRRR
jgi:hypothetical protein